MTRSWDGGRDTGSKGASHAGEVPVGASSWVLIPGTVVADRYRILERLGGGGMGQVFRAEDTTLHQTVALKFLLAEGPSGAALVREVQQARQVTHPQVVRVHDIAEWQGRTFLSMEMVTGEDLASLIRRIGHLPRAKALDVTREICLGLQAAHQSGVLHRDLKPANVLLDREGRARLTDFGVAASVDTEIGDLAGTPAYMAPELFTGAAPSVRTDVYSLGVLLYELFTGRPMFDAKSMTELLQAHRQPPTPPSELVAGIDRDIEELILDCVQRDPANRPGSALAVLARLPGIDLLGEALARGETPSPELVAAAGGAGVRRRVRSWGLAGLLVGLLGVLALVSPEIKLINRVLIPEAPQVLARDAERVLEGLGFDTRSGGRASGFAVNEPFMRALQPADAAPRWHRLDNARPSALVYWFRTSPDPLMARALAGRVQPDDPPFNQPGMSRIVLDSDGALRLLQVVPRRGEGQATSPAQLEQFRDQVLVAARLRDLEPSPVAAGAMVGQPEHFADSRAAWELTEPGGRRVQIEVAMLRGSPVEAVVVDSDWRDALAGTPRSIPAGVVTTLNVVKLGALLGALVLAWISLVEGRGDRRGAFRFALVVFALQFLATVFSMDHSSVAAEEGRLLLNGLARSLLVAAQYWLFYLAIEPQVRRHWPNSIVGWTRMLSGRFGDRKVADALLIGMCLGATGLLAAVVGNLIHGWTADLSPPPLFTAARSLEVLEGPRHRLGAVLEILVFYTGFAMVFFVGLVLCRILLRRSGLAVVAWGSIQTVLWLLQSPEYPTVWHVVLFGALSALCLWAVIRVGVLALLFGSYAFGLLLAFPLVLDPQHWLFGATLFGAAVLGAALLWGLRGSLGPRPTRA